MMCLAGVEFKLEQWTVADGESILTIVRCIDTYRSVSDKYRQLVRRTELL